jgi:gamma-glutamyltranspeptidase/glutathione hydrolase
VFSASFRSSAVAADHPLASCAGAEILRAGGNAVDAAVATSFALSVVRPYSCGVGGGGFMLVRLVDHSRSGAARTNPVTCALNYRETCPAAVDPHYFERADDPDAPSRGGRSVAIPGHVAGMLHALDKFGVLPRESVLAPAIRLARDGYEADAHQVQSSQEVIEYIRTPPHDGRDRTRRFSWLWKRLLREGRISIGDRITLPEQGDLLAHIARDGASAFSSGATARAIVAATSSDHGELSTDDLRLYRVREMQPLVTRALNRTFLSMPPPSSGGVVVAQVLSVLEHRASDLASFLREHPHNSPECIHIVTEALKHAFADRAHFLSDPDHTDVPIDELLDPRMLAARAQSLNARRTSHHNTYGIPSPSSDVVRDTHGTSHLCVVDSLGNAVSCSETINLVYGSLVAVPECGFILNDTMDDFVTRPGSPNAFHLSHDKRNLPAPGKRPASCMTPTIVLDGLDADAPIDLLAGGSGGPRIISATIQAMLNAILWGCTPGEAVSRPRFHHQWKPDLLQLEPALLEAASAGELREMGHALAPRDPVGAVQMIRHTKNSLEAACDPRKGGRPAGDEHALVR